MYFVKSIPADESGVDVYTIVANIVGIVDNADDSNEDGVNEGALTLSVLDGVNEGALGLSFLLGTYGDALAFSDINTTFRIEINLWIYKYNRKRVKKMVPGYLSSLARFMECIHQNINSTTIENPDTVSQRINVKNKNNMTFLHQATHFDCYDICEYLIKNGACIDVQDKYGNSPIMYVNISNIYMYKLFVRNGANLLLVNVENETIFDRLFRKFLNNEISEQILIQVIVELLDSPISISHKIRGGTSIFEYIWNLQIENLTRYAISRKKDTISEDDWERYITRSILYDWIPQEIINNFKYIPTKQQNTTPRSHPEQYSHLHQEPQPGIFHSE